MQSPEHFNKLMHELHEISSFLVQMNKYRFADQYIDNEEFTAMLKVSKKTAALWRDSAFIPYAQIGKKIYYRLSDIETLFDKEFSKPKALAAKNVIRKFNLKNKGPVIKM